MAVRPPGTARHRAFVLQADTSRRSKIVRVITSILSFGYRDDSSYLKVVRLNYAAAPKIGLLTLPKGAIGLYLWPIGPLRRGR